MKIFYVVGIILYIFIQIHHYKLKYGIAYCFFHKCIKYFNELRNTRLLYLYWRCFIKYYGKILIIICPLIFSCWPILTSLWYFMGLFLMFICFCVNYEDKYPFAMALLSGIEIGYIWVLGMITTEYNTFMIFINVLMVVVPTVVILNWSKENIRGYKYLLLWLLFLLINMTTLLYTCGAIIITLDDSKKMLDTISLVMKFDVGRGAAMILYVGIHNALNPSMLLPSEIGLEEILRNFKYDDIRSVFVWAVLMVEMTIFTFYHPDAPQYKEKNI